MRNISMSQSDLSMPIAKERREMKQSKLECQHLTDRVWRTLIIVISLIVFTSIVFRAMYVQSQEVRRVAAHSRG